MAQAFATPKEKPVLNCSLGSYVAMRVSCWQGKATMTEDRGEAHHLAALLAVVWEWQSQAKKVRYNCMTFVSVAQQLGSDTTSSDPTPYSSYCAAPCRTSCGSSFHISCKCRGFIIFTDSNTLAHVRATSQPNAAQALRFAGDMRLCRCDPYVQLKEATENSRQLDRLDWTWTCVGSCDQYIQKGAEVHSSRPFRKT
jgi:hypothetical protein